MTLDEALDLGVRARAAMEARGLDWMSGMRPVRHAPGKGDHGRRGPRFELESAWSVTESPWEVPDVSDPATLGCLLAMIRKRWERPGLVVRPGARGLWSPDGPRLPASLWQVAAPTEAEAYVQLLEIQG